MTTKRINSNTEEEIRSKRTNCKRTGHWAVCCRSKKVDEVRIEKKQSSRKRRVYILRRSFKIYGG